MPVGQLHVARLIRFSVQEYPNKSLFDCTASAGCSEFVLEMWTGYRLRSTLGVSFKQGA
jgi:hypothetical protein